MRKVRFIVQRFTNSILKVRFKEIKGDMALVCFDDVIGDGWVKVSHLHYTVDEAWADLRKKVQHG